MAFGLAAVGAAGTASISVTEGSEVERNEVCRAVQRERERACVCVRVRARARA